MPKLRVHNLAMSVDGYVAGPDQSRDAPLGLGGEDLHNWMFATQFGRQMMGEEGGEEGVDNDFLNAGVDAIGATIMGRNMFGPIRGEWGDDDWKGWWGPEPPYHHPVFVLTHHPRDPIPMEGGTTFNFVTEGPEAALEQAFDAAGGQDVRLGGGALTVNQYLQAGLVDELHVAIVPMLLGAGARLFEGVDISGYACSTFVASPSVAHVRLSKSSD